MRYEIVDDAKGWARKLAGVFIAIKNGAEVRPTPEFVIKVAVAVSSPDSDEEILVQLEHGVPYCPPGVYGGPEKLLAEQERVRTLTLKKNKGDNTTFSAKGPSPWSPADTVDFRVELLADPVMPSEMDC
jgi:hypothetical protein